MACYFIAQLNIHDRERYAQYLEGTDAPLAAHGARVLAVDESVTVLEGEWAFGRTVVIEFPTREHLEAWYSSPEYGEIAAHRRAAATGNAVVAHGPGEHPEARTG